MAMESSDARKALLSAAQRDSADCQMEAGAVRRLAFPAGSAITVNRKGDDLLEISLPRNGLSSRAIFCYAFFVLYMVLIAFIFSDLNALDAMYSGEGNLHAACPLVILGAAVIFVSLTVLLRAFSRHHLIFTRAEFTIAPSLLGRRCATASRCCRRGLVEGKAADVLGVKVVVAGGEFAGFLTAVEISEGVRRHRVAETLSVVEKQWLAQQIGEFLGCHYSTEVSLA